MALFSKDNTNSAFGEINYRGMGKDQLIMLVQSQKRDIDMLNRKLSEAASSVDDKNNSSQQISDLSAENETLKASNETLKATNETLKASEAELKKKLAAKENELISMANNTETAEITEIGSIAEMSFRVNGVMEAAQKAADDYVAKIKEMYDAMSSDYSVYEMNAKQKAESIINNANNKADIILKKANNEANTAEQKANIILANANHEAEAIRQNARKEANDIWSTLQTRFNSYVAGKKQN
ncbi:MAG: hypothetical protein UFA98_11280 [Ruminococcus sp.]|nr:hypothetical protein [Ruminococcus sp.]